MDNIEFNNDDMKAEFEGQDQFEDLRGEVAVHALNIREYPTLESKIVGVLVVDTEVTITDESNGFGKLGDGTGWVKIEYLEFR